MPGEFLKNTHQVRTFLRYRHSSLDRFIENVATKDTLLTLQLSSPATLRTNHETN